MTGVACRTSRRRNDGSAGGRRRLPSVASVPKYVSEATSARRRCVRQGRGNVRDGALEDSAIAIIPCLTQPPLLLPPCPPRARL
jgi:hypothetical protein